MAATPRRVALCSPTTTGYGIGVVSATLSALVTTPTVVRSSTVFSTDLGLLADAMGTSSKEAFATSSSSMDTMSSSVLVSTTAPSSPKEAPKAVLSSAELTSAATVSALEIVSATSILASSSSISYAAALDGTLLSLEDDELSKSSYTRRKRKLEDTIFTKSKVP